MCEVEDENGFSMAHNRAKEKRIQSENGGKDGGIKAK